MEHQINIFLCLHHSRRHRSRRTGETCNGQFFILKNSLHPVSVLKCLYSIAQEPKTEREEVQENNRQEEKSEQQTEGNGEETDTLMLHYLGFQCYCTL